MIGNINKRTITLIQISFVIFHLNFIICIDYCDPSLCAENELHIACNNDGVC